MTEKPTTKPAGTSKALKPIYYIYSKEPVIITEAISRLKKNFYGSDEEANIHNIELKDGDMRELYDAALTVPFIAEKRLIIVKGLEKLDKNSAKQLSPLFENITDDRMIVFSGQAPLRGSEIKKMLEENGEIFEYAVPSRRELPNFIRNRFKAIKLSVQKEVVDLLIDKYGTDISALISEIEKIGLYNGPSGTVEISEIRKLLSSSHGTANIFIFMDAVAERRTGLALGYFEELLRSGETANSMLYSITNHFRTLLKARYCIDEAMTDQDTRRAIEGGKKMPDFRFQRIYKQANNFSLKRLKAIHRELLMTELSIKKEGEDDRFVLEKLIFKIGETAG